MNTEATVRDKRLSGNQIVILVLALCVTLVLAPVGVYAAVTQNVSIADAQLPRRTVKVDAQRRLSTVTSGTVVARPAPPATPFHRAQMTTHQVTTLGAPIPQGRGLAITSLSVATPPNGQHIRFIIRQASSSGACGTTGSLRGVVAWFWAPPGQTGAEISNFSQTFPTPSTWRKTDRALCLQVESVDQVAVVVDGYLF